jgi:DNA-nicking Smr family endonuclease
MTMTRPGKPSPEEIEEFRRSVGPVRRLHHDRVSAPHKAASTRPRRPEQAFHAADADRLSDYAGPSPVGAGDDLLFMRPGVQHRQLQQLRRGRFRTRSELDLHGMNTAQARRALTGFLAQCQADQVRQVRIIHGKGYGSAADAPVLKNRVNAWLRQHPAVLAFSSAQLRDGGTGAVYVLLRTQRD